MKNKESIPTAINDLYISGYQKSDAPELLRLLTELQSVYFSKIVSKLKQELDREKDAVKSYRAYIEEIEGDLNGQWKVFLAKTSEGKTIGFIIGSITKDEELINGAIGKIEDWLVEDEYRGKAVGLRLYEALENWFIERGCNQVESDTWAENEISIIAHKKLGFAITGVQFTKKLG